MNAYEHLKGIIDHIDTGRDFSQDKDPPMTDEELIVMAVCGVGLAITELANQVRNIRTLG